jgi:hypothetical protein
VEATFVRHAAPFSVTSVGSLVLLHAQGSGRLADLHRAALEEGVYLAPRGLMSVSTPMDASTIDEVAERLGRAIERTLRP